MIPSQEPRLELARRDLSAEQASRSVTGAQVFRSSLRRRCRSPRRRWHRPNRPGRHRVAGARSRSCTGLAPSLRRCSLPATQLGNCSNFAVSRAAPTLQH